MMMYHRSKRSAPGGVCCSEGSTEMNGRLQLVTENISREAVIKAIAELILNSIVGMKDWETQLASKTTAEQERIRQNIKIDEESIITLMKLATDLGLYEDVNGRITIPKHIKEDYWGPEHPNAQSP
jgi:hypothetical protein